MEKFQISVIIINFNSANFTIECIKSIKKFVDTSLSYNIIIVDNNSIFDDYQKLKFSLIHN